MRYLALDIGTRRTGVAYLDTDIGIALPFDTLEHTSQEEMVERVLEIVRARKIDQVLVGLPLLPSGKDGAQAAISRSAGALIAKSGVVVEYRDERYTTPKKSGGKHTPPAGEIDGDAAAACILLNSLKTS